MRFVAAQHEVFGVWAPGFSGGDAVQWGLRIRPGPGLHISYVFRAYFVIHARKLTELGFRCILQSH